MVALRESSATVQMFVENWRVDWPKPVPSMDKNRRNVRTAFNIELPAGFV